MEPAPPERLHTLVMELVRVTGLLQPHPVVTGETVSLSQGFALYELDVHGPLSQRELAERMYLEKSTVSRLAADLERRGLLTRERDPGNRRLYRLRLTGTGRALRARLAKVADEQYARWVGAMSPAELNALLTGLPALIRAVRGTPPPHHGPGDGSPA